MDNVKEIYEFVPLLMTHLEKKHLGGIHEIKENVIKNKLRFPSCLEKKSNIVLHQKAWQLLLYVCVFFNIYYKQQ